MPWVRVGVLSDARRQHKKTPPYDAPSPLPPMPCRHGVVPLEGGGIKGGGDSSEFSRLAERLEKKIGRIETEFRDSIANLSSDIRKMLHAKNIAFDEKTI